MNKQSLLQLQAIKAAKQGNWDDAIAKNQELVEFSPNDLGALNRLGTAYLQIKKTKEAKETFEKVLEFDKSNSIAQKHLANIKSKRKAKAPTFSHEQFIEEPGTTKIVELHRLASKTLLDKLTVGQECDLVTKNRYVSVETKDGEYVGALPEDLSYRLTKLMKRGNKYQGMVHSSNGKQCFVYIKEVLRSKRNENINSFPLNRVSITAINDVDERFLLEENIPVSIVHTDNDNEKTLDDIEAPEEE